MKKYLSPGIFWLLFFIITIALMINKYVSNKENFYKFSWIYVFILFIFILCTIYTYYADKPKPQGASIASFAFGVVCFIPLLNLIFGIPAIYIGVKSLKKIKQNPKENGGKWFSILGIIFGALVYATYLTGLGMCLIDYKSICSNLGLTFLAK